MKTANLFLDSILSDCFFWSKNGTHTNGKPGHVYKLSQTEGGIKHTRTDRYGVLGEVRDQQPGRICFEKVLEHACFSNTKKDRISIGRCLWSRESLAVVANLWHACCSQFSVITESSKKVHHCCVRHSCLITSLLWKKDLCHPSRVLGRKWEITGGALYRESTDAKKQVGAHPHTGTYVTFSFLF